MTELERYALQQMNEVAATMNEQAERIAKLEEENERLINSEERAWLEVQSLRDELVAEKKARER